FFFSSRRRHTRWPRDWSSDVCSSDLSPLAILTKSGELYMPLSAQLPDRDERRRLLPYAGKYVRATGRLFERGGTDAISIEKLEEIGRASCRERVYGEGG